MALDTPLGRRQWEQEMLGEYVAARWPQARVMLHVRLGPIVTLTDPTLLDPAERRWAASSARRWADAVVVDAGRLWVVEVSLLPELGKISQLLAYLELVPVTPDLEELRALPRRGRLVWGTDEPYTRSMAVRHGLEVDLFTPSHWREWVTTQTARETIGRRKTRPVGAERS